MKKSGKSYAPHFDLYLRPTAGLWAAAWGIELLWIPKYYFIRYKRWDYPHWADAIAIPIVSEGIGIIFLGTVTLILFAIFLWKRDFQSPPQWHKPVSVWGWLRAGFLVLWMGSFLISIPYSILGGDMGMMVVCLLLAFLLGRVLLAPPKVKSS